jgi:glucose/arabinose dehydrogenase
MRSVTLALALMVAAAAAVSTQQAREGGPAGRAGGPAARAGGPAPLGVPVAPLGDGPWIIDTAEQHKVRLSVVTKGLVNPWSMTWLPDGNILVTERPGRLRIIRNGLLDPTPISGVPMVKAQRLSGLMDIVLHPNYAQNHVVYLTYNKGRDDGMMATVLARGTFDGKALAGVKDIYVATPWWDGAGGSASRVAFGRDGKLYMTTGSGGGANAGHGQMTDITKGKILRLNDDGTVPKDNPFVGKPGFAPEIFSYGHRNSLGLIVHPVTGDLWNSENGPQGGDEINIVKAGKNYGWPVVSMGRDYPGPWQGHFEKEGMEGPIVYWEPAIAASNLMIYTGDKFPAWKNNAFIGAMRMGEIPGTGHLERVVFNDKYEDIRREIMFWELHQRIRDVRQGADGFIYLLTDEAQGALLKMEPAS